MESIGRKIYEAAEKGEAFELHSLLQEATPEDLQYTDEV
jgi:hypothetical protein